MASTGTADNMNSAVSRLTQQREGLRFDHVDPFAPAGRIGFADDYEAEFNAIEPTPAAPRPTHSGVNGKKKRRAKPRKQVKLTESGKKLRKMAAPVLLALAIGLVVPAVWSVLVLAGLNVAMSDHEAAKPMAGMMLICWPLAAFMAVAAGWMIRDLLLAE